jgi:hypothetical protein
VVVDLSNRVHLSTIHPRLFHSLVLLDPVINLIPYRADPPLATIATFRKDVWPSYTEAQTSVKKSRFYKTWDPRVIGKLVDYGFRQGPTETIPDIESKEVTLITSKHQEAFTVARSNYDDVGVDRMLGAEERLTHPDMYENDPAKAPFYRPEIRQAYFMLESLRPGCLYVLGNKSPYKSEAGLEEKFNLIGTGVGGSGGLRVGRVKIENVSGGHFFPFESVPETAELLKDWVQAEAARSEKEEQVMQELWEGKTGRERQMVDERWKENIRPWKGRTAKTKL